MSGEQSHLTNCLAQFIAGSQWEAIPPEVRREGVRGLLNCALGGAPRRGDGDRGQGADHLGEFVPHPIRLARVFDVGRQPFGDLKPLLDG